MTRNPLELKLEKVGNSVLCSYKHSGAPTWFVIGEVAAELGGTFYVGPAVSSAIRGTHALLKTGVLNIIPATAA